ncbi:hypothetical protein GFS03_03830 [Sulfolobus sp. E5-1-F]|uniref:hypothetical protein n=1 Tax=Saccharolobus sp. E5-1-F TaxID=2663019 RepID=UPI001295715F|nr:hypothetical protein [Sulfolobus sp. E5-1-F]QGA53778.1 hypothetical protein GFS03_03830 [Sulfolobus sp. E5-1-F]
MKVYTNIEKMNNNFMHLKYLNLLLLLHRLNAIEGKGCCKLGRKLRAGSLAYSNSDGSYREELQGPKPLFSVISLTNPHVH